MSDMVMSIDAVAPFLEESLRSDKVRIRQTGDVITIVPFEDDANEKEYSCPLVGIAKDSALTVEKFLEWKREDRELEYEQELRREQELRS